MDGRPVSAVTQDFLAWCHTSLTAQGMTALRLLWDHASWHTSQAVRSWLRAHHQRVKRSGQGLRMLSCWLPVTSPWLNPIEPTWVHGKRAVTAAERLLSAAELEARVYAYDGCTPEPHLVMPKRLLECALGAFRTIHLVSSIQA